MKRVAYLPLAMAVALALPGCGPQEQATNAPEAVATAAPDAGNQAKKAALPACPFQQTRDWHASIENGRILVNGRVDLLMAGFKPTLAPELLYAPDLCIGAFGFRGLEDQRLGGLLMASLGGLPYLLGGLVLTYRMLR